METIRDAVAFILSILAKPAGTALRSRLSRLSLWFLPNTPALAGAWVVSFRNPLPGGASRIQKIDALLMQFGRRVQGSGHVQGEPGDPFEYQGWIVRNAFFGEFRRKTQNVLAGTGTFVVKISADGRELRGRCGWYDSDLDAVWSSRYEWVRRSRPSYWTKTRTRGA